jgi:hypothetical protein
MKGFRYWSSSDSSGMPTSLAIHPVPPSRSR